MFIEYKPGEKHPGANAERSETRDAFDDCGMMLTDDDVVIDIDHIPKESIEAMINQFGIKTMAVWTDRGVHLWFKKPSWFVRRKDGVCRLGFEIEVKTKSVVVSTCVKRNGIERRIDNYGIQQYLPSIFKVDKRFNDMTGFDEGDGRNKALFAHRKILDKENVPDISKILGFINKYVFNTPLEDSEVETISRDMTATSDKDSEQNYIADVIMSQNSTVVYSSLIWFYQGNQYVSDENNNRLIRRVYQACEGKSTSFVDEVIKQIRYRSPYIPDGMVFPIKFKNGIVHDGQFIPMSDYRDFTPYYIDIYYNPEAPPVEIVDNYINALTDNDPEYKTLLMEIMGYSLITDPEKIRSLGKFFMFRGDGANGKGTLLQIMKKIYNEKNCTSLSIKQLADDRFKVTMIGKLANLGDDIEAEAIDNDQLKIIKNISTADRVTTRRLYSQSESTVFTTKLYFTTNTDIHSFEKGYAYKRRVVWLPMFNKVDKPDPKFITRITTKEALEYWVRLIVDGYIRLYSNTEWTICKKVEEYNNAYHEENNPCHMFAKDLKPEDILGKTIKDMREMFYEWDTEDRKFSSKLFKAAVWDLYHFGIGVAYRAGRSVRVFMRDRDTTQALDH